MNILDSHYEFLHDIDSSIDKPVSYRGIFQYAKYKKG